MSQRVSFNIRLTPKELQDFKTSLNQLQEVSSLSDLFRTGAKAYIDQENPLRETTLDDTLNAILTEFRERENRLMEEIQLNRSYLMTIQENMQFQSKQEVLRMKEEYIDQIIGKWMIDPDLLQHYNTLEDLEDSIEEEHLKDIVIDAIQVMVERNQVKIGKSNKLRWQL